MKRATSLPIVLTRAFVIFLALAAAIARAEDRPASAPEPAPAAVWPPGLVQEGLSQAGAKGFLDATGTRVYGFVETGFTGRLTGGQEPLPGRLLDSRQVNDLRLNHAKEYLRATDEPVARIAEAVGFENASYFIRRFKRHEGVTPAVYRRRWQQE